MKLSRIINELDFLRRQYRGSFVTTVPFTAVIDGRKIKANAMAHIQYTWRDGVVDIDSYDVVQITPKRGKDSSSMGNVIPARLMHDAMRATLKKIEDGSMDKNAATHFQNVQNTGPKAARAFNRPRKRKPVE
jgi:hypothetical protein